ncbi:MAG TPA: PhzF family phenazine biosynthesis protein [Candidatus Corynebacterium avicola]|uniref:PhzF family phenazine biosynthesis protein n=1 Tax=Candidatus Corynebacterium avicola TaxID=2838527 RepID=A0A9D1UM64_9CORY|nr:PhzF family phenazine biosynthesis protein [Candidatus Corynebacterium avicola]
MSTRPFAQVDVFSPTPYLGNPLAVILDATGLSDEQMQDVARWTNLSETTFVLPPTSQDADYRVRIFTPGGEVPFAGHPTLGTAHAWLENGGTPRQDGVVVQECGVGLVEIAVGSGDTAGELAFTAPPTVRSGAVSDADLERFCAALGIERDKVVDHQWGVNGPEWAVVKLPSAQDVLDLRPDFTDHPDLMIGVVGFYGDGNADGADVEVRAFAPVAGIDEDPVTGSLNASIGQWLLRSGQVTGTYTASQGTVMGRTGRVTVTPTEDGGNVLIGGPVTTLIKGSIEA